MTSRYFKNKQLTSLDPRRVLIIKPSALGDICHSMPVLEYLRQRFPNSKIDWVCNKSFAELLINHPFINQLIQFDRRATFPFKLSSAWLDLIFKLRAGKYDLVLDLQGLLRSAVMSLVTGSKIRVGPFDAREGALAFYTHVTEAFGSDPHAVMRNWSFARLFGANGPPGLGLIKPDLLSIQAVEKLLGDFPKPYWVLAPGARWMTKRWPTGHFAEIGKRLVSRFGGTLLLVGAPDETKLTNELASNFNSSCLNLGGKTAIRILAALLSVADLVVANDSGPLHLACSLGRPVASPYLCTKVELTGPYRQFSRAIAAPIYCSGSLVRKCPTNQECMSVLTPDMLWEAIVKSFFGMPPWKIETV